MSPLMREGNVTQHMVLGSIHNATSEVIDEILRPQASPHKYSSFLVFSFCLLTDSNHMLALWFKGVPQIKSMVVIASYKLTMIMKKGSLYEFHKSANLSQPCMNAYSHTSLCICPE